jgi:hypothetical protein
MRLGGEMDDCIWALRLKDSRERARITNVDLAKLVIRVGLRRRKRFQVPGVRQTVNVYDPVARLCDQLSNKCRTDEAGTTGYQVNGHLTSLMRITSKGTEIVAVDSSLQAGRTAESTFAPPQMKENEFLRQTPDQAS